MESQSQNPELRYIPENFHWHVYNHTLEWVANTITIYANTIVIYVQ